MSQRERWALIACVLAACSRDDPFADLETSVGESTTSSTTSDVAEASSSDTGAPLPPACDCAEDDRSAEPLQPPTCMPLLCDVAAACTAGFDSGFDCSNDAPFDVDDADLSCALTALRDRTLGVVAWELRIDNGFTTRHGYVVVLDDGAVVTREAGVTDGFDWYCDAILGAMPSAERFADCLALESPEAKFGCLSFDPDPPLVVCDAADDPGTCP